MSILVKAMELGAALSGSEELKQVQAAKQAMFADADALALLQEFQQRHQEFELLRAQGQRLTPEQKEAFQDIQMRMNENELVRSYFVAQERFDNVLRQVNQILNQAIQGPAGCCSAENSCAGCGEECGE